MNILVVLNSQAPIILTGTTTAQFAQDVEEAYMDNKPTVKSYTEQSMGAIEVNLMTVAYFREYGV